MARKRVVSRTINTKVVTAEVLNKSTKEFAEMTFTFGDDVAVSRVNAAIEKSLTGTDNMLINVTKLENKTERYEMPEAMFVSICTSYANGAIISTGSSEYSTGNNATDTNNGADNTADHNEGTDNAAEPGVTTDNTSSKKKSK